MNIFDTLEKFLKKHKISGIFFVPNYGSATIFKNDLHKLAILDHAQLEIEIEKKLRTDEVSNRIILEAKKTKQKSPSYIR